LIWRVTLDLLGTLVLLVIEGLPWLLLLEVLRLL
jgi:hypothetical protein